MKPIEIFDCGKASKQTQGITTPSFYEGGFPPSNRILYPGG
jgi:hypothetical protein